MRPFLCGASILVGLFFLGGGLEPASDAAMVDSQASVWRRTVDGWENTRLWQPRPLPYHPPLRPTLVAAFELLVSLLALAAWSGRSKATSARLPASNSVSPPHHAPVPQLAFQHQGAQA